MTFFLSLALPLGTHKSNIFLRPCLPLQFLKRFPGSLARNKSDQLETNHAVERNKSCCREISYKITL